MKISTAPLMSTTDLKQLNPSSHKKVFQILPRIKNILQK